MRAGLGRFYLRERLSGGLSYAANPPFVATMTGLRYLDSTTQPYAGRVQRGRRLALVGREVNAVYPNSWTWNLTFERELFRNATLELSYVGTKQLDQLQFYDANQVAPGDINGNGIDDRLDFARAGSDTGIQASVRPYGVFGNTQHLDLGPRRQVELPLRSRRSSSAGSGAARSSRPRTPGRSRPATSPWTTAAASAPTTASATSRTGRLDWGPTKMNRPHIFNASLVLMLPSFENKSGFVKHVLGDWEIASIAAGLLGPVDHRLRPTPRRVSPPLTGTGYSGNQRPMRVAGVSCRASGGNKEQILNPDAFTLTGYQLGTTGDSGRGVCEGPRYFQVDLSLYKNINISKRVKAQLRFEMFNIFNHVNFLQGSGINPTLAPLDATYDTGDPAYGDQSPATRRGRLRPGVRTRDARQAQFGIKLTF